MPLIQFIQVILPLKIEWEPYYRADAELQRRDQELGQSGGLTNDLHA